MREVLSDLERWREQDRAVALATVLQTWGSAPRGVGAKMALTADGEIAGSVSGGCVEGAVFETGQQVLKTGQPQLLHFGVADETAWEVGLACGGSIDVFVQPLNANLYAAARAALVEEQPAASVTIVRGPAGSIGRGLVLREDGSVTGVLGDGLDEPARAAASAALLAGQSRRVALPDSIRPGSETEPVEIFIDVMLPAPTLIAVGGVHIAIALTALAKTLGYRTIVVDPRRIFGSDARFPHVDRLIQAWPDEALAQLSLTRSTALAMLTHDPKLDDPALLIALPSPAFYVGALGSRNTQAQRRERLRAAGLSEAQLARLQGPIGIDIGAKTPEEIALAVVAQVTAARNGRI
ncbi:MAG TPA: XdhC/CoxI family protein [Anaerolineae bacterium]|nr:XdhC/CoxI family protein [Anaerolineae bacterium]